jgi:hypothetical protein
MIEPKIHDLLVKQGSIYEEGFHWYGGGKICANIENVTVGCPTNIQVTDHGLPSISPTPIHIRNVRGARALNTGDTECDMVLATYVDDDNFTIDIDTGNQRYKANSGSIEWYQPKNLTSWTAELQIREKIDDAVPLVTLTSGGGDITISIPDARIVFTIDTVTTEGLDFIEGVYDLELIDPAAEATRVLEGKVFLSKEVTR